MNLDELIAKLEAVDEPASTLDMAIANEIDGPHLDYTASIEAASALVPEGCRLKLTERSDGGWEAILATAHTHYAAGSFPGGKLTSALALALCIAALKARKVQWPATH